MNTLSDNAIMMRVKAGDLDRMGLLFERHHARLYRFLFHMTYQRDVAEDMVQQVFYKMLRYRNGFTGTGEFIHWMYAIARNVIKDQGKRKKLPMVSSTADEMADWLPGSTDIEAQLERKQAAAALHQAMAYLSEEEREILSLSRFQELKHQEIADIMGITEGAVKVRVHRALQQLKQIYLKGNAKQETK